MKSIKSIKSLSSRLLAEEALRRGITVKHLNPYQDDEAFLELDYKKHKEFIIGQRISKTSLEAYWILENKELTKEFLKRNNINVATGKVFKKDNFDKVVVYCEKIKFPVVIKPVAGAHGKNVYTNINNKKELKAVLKEVLKKNNYILTEKMFLGTEYRLVATRNKFLAATNRVPANVIGDGVNTIKNLIKIKNRDPRRGNSFTEGKPLIKINIDNILKGNLKKNGLRLNTVISKGERIYLRNNSNLSTGGDSIDVTNSIHPDLKKIVIKAVRAIPELVYAGIDLMISKDVSKKPTKNSYIIVEMNSSPGIFMHHFPCKGKSRNVTKEIIDILFPETKKSINKYETKQ
ncbi:glutamate ligase [Candidatus Parcubacteria bacterium]|nr:glutamate ligase [Candidatus Parcubacteria bacterium]